MIDFWNTESWFAVYAKPYQAGLAATGVGRLNAEILFPQIKSERNIGGIARANVKPLFPGYFFARFTPVLLYDSVRSTPGVVRVVGTPKFPTPLDDEIIEAIRARISEDGFVRLTRETFNPGDWVSIDGGPWEGTIGRFESEWDDGKRVAILLEAMNQARVLVGRDLVSQAM